MSGAFGLNETIVFLMVTVVWHFAVK